MEHYDGPAFYRNNSQKETTPKRVEQPAKSVAKTETVKRPQKNSAKKAEKLQDFATRAFSPKYVPRSVVSRQSNTKKTDYEKLIWSMKKEPDDYLLFESTVFLGTKAIDLTVKNPIVSVEKQSGTSTIDKIASEKVSEVSDSTTEVPSLSESASEFISQSEVSSSELQTRAIPSDSADQSASVTTSEESVSQVIRSESVVSDSSQSESGSESLSVQAYHTSQSQTETNVVREKMTGLKAAMAHEANLVEQEKQESLQVTPQMTQDFDQKGYQLPPLSLLPAPVIEDDPKLDEWVNEQVVTLNETLKAFHVDATVSDWTIGPTVTQFELTLGRGVKVNKITNLTDDLKLALAAKDIRIEAPIPGKSSVGIEIPNKVSRPVMLSEVLRSQKFQTASSPLTIALGVDLFGEPQITDIQKMPHGLIAGATGSGKSVFINSLLVSLLYKASPNEVKLVLIDPKAVEMAPYHDLPHLLAPVIFDPQAAAAALKWLVNEMEERYQRLAAAGARNIEAYNQKAKAAGEYGLQLPYIVVIIDELADLMMAASSEVQDYIARITQKARAAGIHLIVATQRPSVDVVTGTIKNNIPTRIAFMVASQVDSRTILDTAGAERLLGRGDMLYLGNGSGQPMRLQGTYIEDEVDFVTDFIRQQGKPRYAFDPDNLKKRALETEKQDELMPRVLDYIVNEETISTSKLQRVFSIGYNRAASLIEDLEAKQYISPAHGAKPRKVFLTQEGLDKLRTN